MLNSIHKSVTHVFSQIFKCASWIIATVHSVDWILANQVPVYIYILLKRKKMTVILFTCVSLHFWHHVKYAHAVIWLPWQQISVLASAIEGMKTIYCKNSGAVTFFNVKMPPCTFEVQGFMELLCTSAGLLQYPTDRWHIKTMHERNQYKHMWSLCLPDLWTLPSFLHNSDIYLEHDPYHMSVVARWALAPLEIIGGKPDTPIYNHYNFWKVIESMGDDGQHHVRRSDLFSSRKEGV